MSKEVTLVKDEGGDWIGMYVDGRLMNEGHSLDTDFVIENLGFTVCKVFFTAEDWEKHGGRCPATLAEVYA